MSGVRPCAWLSDPVPGVSIRAATAGDMPAIWPLFRDIVAAGETYAIDRDSTEADFQRLWFDLPQQTLVAEEDGVLLGTYYIKPNGAGPSGHVCNCGYMVSPAARGRGIAATMCTHSQTLARSLGYRLMQFNGVVTTNTGAVRLWRKLGFDIVGRVPRAFDHPTEGLVDTLVMVKWLDPA